MKFVTYKDRIYMGKEGASPQTTSDLQHGLLEQVDARVEVVDPQVEEDAQEDHQTHTEDHQVDRPEEIITTETEMTSREMMRAATSLEK